MSDTRDIVERLENEARIFEQTLLDDTVDLIREAAAEIDRLREERRWVTVGERLPPVGRDEKVLVAWRYEDERNEALVVSEAWHLRLGLFIDKEEFEFPSVKFWQPMPPGPEGDA